MKLCWILLLVTFLFAAVAASASEKTKLLTGAYYDTTTSQIINLTRDVVLNQPVICFSNGAVVWLDNDADLHVDSRGLEHDPKGGYYFTVGIQIGEVYFVLPKAPDETSVMMVNTQTAEIEIHSSQFSVEVDLQDSQYITIIRCHEGYLSLTNSRTFETVKVEAGRRASIFSKEDDRNSSVIVSSVEERNIHKWMLIRHRKLPLGSPTDIEWYLKDNRYLVKRS